MHIKNEIGESFCPFCSKKIGQVVYVVNIVDEALHFHYLILNGKAPKFPVLGRVFDSYDEAVEYVDSIFYENYPIYQSGKVLIADAESLYKKSKMTEEKKRELLMQ